MPQSSDSTDVARPGPRTISVLFVCLGNICRSPMAHAHLQHVTSHLPAGPIPVRVRVDSAGTGAYHAGAPPDERTQATLAAHGIPPLKHHAARKISDADFANFDYILAMDKENLTELHERRRRAARASGGAVKADVALYGDYGGKRGEEIEDPYYGGDDGFEEAFEQCERFSRGFVNFIKAQHGAPGASSSDS